MADKKNAKQQQQEDEDFNCIVRSANSDIDGLKRTVIGPQQIKGVRKRVAPIVVKKAGVDPAVKIVSL